MRLAIVDSKPDLAQRTGAFHHITDCRLRLVAQRLQHISTLLATNP